LILFAAASAFASSSSFPKTDKGLWDFIHYARRHWTYEKDHPGELCQRPEVSNKLWKGDCDDFAVMVAYYLQEYWGYDTYIIGIEWTDEPGGHWVAFLHVSEQSVKRRTSKCENYPYMTQKRGGRKWFYIPIDRYYCPSWEWTREGSSSATQYEWDDLVDKPI